MKNEIEVQESAIEKAVRLAGGQSALAAVLNKFPQSIQQYCKSGRVPAEHCIKVERAVQGRVTRYQLRPDVFGNPPNAHKRFIPSCTIIFLKKDQAVA